ncbi:hypothetical protein WA026_007802 [Henosepilachna vigintioctopunctata]|uniref:Uncharacterized protein n=1 Tax=Henosepilachna vigintioctopunctata TaxID=420089 RepID=A0AAW1TYQ8_9CUCU
MLVADYYISDREWLDSDAALSQHHITQGSSVVDFRITQEPDDSQHYNGLPVMQETEDNKNMNDVGPIETGHLEEHGEEHIIYTSLPYLKNITPRLTRLFNNAVKMKIANRSVLTINSIFTKLKDKVPRESQMDVVYSIPYIINCKYGHSMDYDSTKVLCRQQNRTRRLFMEMAFIFQETNSMNRKTDIHQLSSVYAYLLFLDTGQTF